MDDDLETAARLLVTAARESIYRSRRAELGVTEILAAALVALWALRGGLPDADDFDAARRLAEDFTVADPDVQPEPAEHGPYL
jgi:hypothetical protein